MANSSPGASIRTMWQRLSPLPGGTWLFSRLVGLMVPYTGSIGAHVRELEPGRSRVTLRDRRKVRNHLDCVHAVALVNIVTDLRIEYLKKARGVLTARSDLSDLSDLSDPSDSARNRVVTSEISDTAGDVVARTHVTWRLSPPA